MYDNLHAAQIYKINVETEFILDGDRRAEEADRTYAKMKEIDLKKRDINVQIAKIAVQKQQINLEDKRDERSHKEMMRYLHYRERVIRERDFAFIKLVNKLEKESRILKLKCEEEVDPKKLKEGIQTAEELTKEVQEIAKILKG